MSEKLNLLSHAIFLLPNITELRTSTQIPWRSCTLPVSSSFCLDLVSPPKMDLRKKRTLSRFRAEHNIQSLASGDWYNYGKSGKHAKDYYVEDHRRVATAFKTNKKHEFRFMSLPKKCIPSLRTYQQNATSQGVQNPPLGDALRADYTQHIRDTLRK